jgi:hypothetical protein
MNLANPMALMWAALAAPIIVFYILKIRLRRVPVSTTLFWRQIFDQKQPRSIWQQLRHLLSLLVQLALLGLLVMALTEPFFPWEALQARRLVLVIDNSASMNATDVEPSRLDQARGQAQRMISGLRFRDEMAIVAAGTEPQVICGLTGHLGTLRQSIDDLPPSDGPTRVDEAIALARRLLGEATNRRIFVVSDGCFTTAEQLVKAEDVQLVHVGRRSGNVAITRFQVRRSLLDPIGYEILAEVTNASDEAVQTRLEVDLNDSPVDVVPLELAAGETWSKTFEKASADGGQLIARLRGDDALASDNTAWALLPRREPQQVVLVTEGNLFLEKVFEANRLVRLSVVKEVPKSVPPGAVLVLHRQVSDPLPAGSLLVIDPAGSSDLWQLGETLQNPIVTNQDKDSELMAHVRLDNVLMPEARQLVPQGTPQVLASALSGAPLYLAFERPAGKTLVFTVNLDQGDLPLRTAFPILASNALQWFSGKKGELRESQPAGAVTEIELADHSALGTPHSALHLISPDGRRRPLAADLTKQTIGPLDRCGIWSVTMAAAAEPSLANPAAAEPSTTTSEPLAEIACNLANREESDLRPPESILQAASRQASLAGSGAGPVWYYLLTLAWLLAAAEWFLYQRRWIS